MKTCLNRIIRRCDVILNGGRCERDYEPISPAHPYNNLNCINHHESNMLTFEITPKEGNLIYKIGYAIDTILWRKNHALD